jgi:hypothetical protein
MTANKTAILIDIFALIDFEFQDASATIKSVLRLRRVSTCFYSRKIVNILNGINNYFHLVCRISQLKIQSIDESGWI